MELKNEKWSLDKFKEIREEVLQQWPTGKDVDFEEAIEYHNNLPEEQIMAEKLAEAKEEDVTLIQPRAGVALIDEHIELLKFLREEGQADLLPSTIDSYTRQNNYEEAEAGIEESREEGRSMLNGFPAVNHGVKACREVVEALDAPLQVRHGTPDARLLAEITLAGGFTDYEGGGLSYNIPYAKNVSIEQTLLDWQYVDRLIGYYEENGIKINREPFGPLTGTLVPPSVSHSVAIIEGLLAAEQGVKNITLGYGQCGNLVQDVAALQSLEELAEEYLADYEDVMLTTVFHQWMGGFPQDEAQAFGVISWGAATAALGKATKVITKTPHEAMGVPTKEANAEGLRSTKQVINMLRDQSLLSNDKLEEEKEMIKQETKQILDRVFELGNGDVAQGTVRAFEAGVLDVPFAPSKYNAGNLLPARDDDGAVRFLNHGNLPFSDEVVEFHQEKLEARGKSEGREPNFQMVIDDIYAIGKGRLVGRPRS
ncbi:methylaspartate mutase subunit E [Acetohalobium arabaticum]|uniref:Glutamate mutase epsilon subunit n=1 Tax=Acetohalobium arabaticum (strain ATCC 49924 / DSM 5501 / Z-7288) TaxID=574087 RepID=D9QUW6_ACEAZ|nr:methylaspartate mutase subunit E [Acetohalobium arabaticum]ADL12025.1 Glutamate mutase subunit E [Acetohalobium arabaticum DSM 5501]